MENNTLAILVAVILMGTMAISMITSASVSIHEDQKRSQSSTSFYDHTRSGLGERYSSN